MPLQMKALLEYMQHELIGFLHGLHCILQYTTLALSWRPYMVCCIWSHLGLFQVIWGRVGSPRVATGRLDRLSDLVEK